MDAPIATTSDAREEKNEGQDSAAKPPLIRVYQHRPEDYEGSCLRPLGLCDLGGCCDMCWYGPNHPRFKEKNQK